MIKPVLKRDNGLVIYISLTAVLSVLSAPYLQVWYHNSRDAATILATVLSILAGFLIAVMTIVADDRSLRGKNWRQDTYYLETIQRQLLRHKFMFNLYLIVLVLIFLASLDLPWEPHYQAWTERVLLGLAVFSLSLSFRLPGEVTTRHIRELKRLIQDRRRSEDIDNDDG